MRVFVVAAMGAALMAGCAPFEHGHYSQDVSYRNTAGDPPGTPLVYRGDSTTEYGSTRTARRDTNWNRSYPGISDRVVAEQPLATRAYPTVAQSSLTPTYSTPSYTQQAYVAPQTYSAPVQQTYSAPVAYAQPVQQSYVQQAAYVQPATQSYTAATSYGATKFDAEGYAICDIPHQSHASHQAHAGHHASHFQRSY